MERSKACCVRTSDCCAERFKIKNRTRTEEPATNITELSCIDLDGISKSDIENDRDFQIHTSQLQQHKCKEAHRLNEKELSKLDKYERFERQFPFYTIDVNAFIVHIKVAMKHF